ncbi:MAG: hypothetical protein IJD73_04975 [Clostridia bacterium]|nr:hypothetical protein [Clostridia bacterium]
MKKILSFLLSMLLILTALSGCAATLNNESGSGESGTDESDTLEIGSSELNSSEAVTDIPSESEKDNDKKEDTSESVKKEPTSSIKTFERSGKYILFGEFPQKLKAANVTVSTQTDSRGYFLGSDGAYYAKVVANACSNGYKFSTGAEVKDGETYYFKVEPIKWVILSESDGVATLLCDSAIAAMQCDADSNIYKDSDIRSWLGNKFFNSAFSATQKSLIEETTVDNSADSTGISSNPYACENTKEKVFLLSYKESLNSAYGFNTANTNADKVRQKQATDYAKATGAYASENGNAIWWLRSPSDNRKFNEKNSRAVSEEGTVIDLYSLVDYACAVPALKLKTK